MTTGLSSLGTVARSGAASRSWTVGALLQAVSETLGARFGACGVEGEITGFSRASSGHCYFVLKDAEGSGASLRCVLFRRAAVLLDFPPADGDRVEVRGRLDLYGPRGELQFVVEAMRRGGAGALYEQFLRLKARLEALGLFDPARKRRLPAHPRAVGVVTSSDAAALRDVIAALARRAPHVRLVLYPSPVQGSAAAAAIAAAIDLASHRAEVDVLVVCRGGGSLEDLWAFNDERVVQAIASASMPVVSGVGHETDVTLADFAADLRAPTPTAAAELVAPARDQALETLAALSTALAARVRSMLDAHAQRLDRSAFRLSRPSQAMQAPARRLALLEQRFAALVPGVARSRREALERLSPRLRRALDLGLAAQRQRLATLGLRLDGLSAERVLARGYAWLADDAGRAIVSARDLRPRARVTAVLSDGSVALTVASPPGRRTGPAKADP